MRRKIYLEPPSFEYKGGREVLETFARLRQEFPGIELVMRTNLPIGRQRSLQGTARSATWTLCSSLSEECACG